jgi:hypothetical protein
MPTTLPPAEALTLDSLVTPTEKGIASFDALALTVSGTCTLTIGGQEVRATPGTIVLMPANVPHAVQASEPACCSSC